MVRRALQKISLLFLSGCAEAVGGVRGQRDGAKRNRGDGDPAVWNHDRGSTGDGRVAETPRREPRGDGNHGRVLEANLQYEFFKAAR
jgi:hypothetical protein